MVSRQSRECREQLRSHERKREGESSVGGPHVSIDLHLSRISHGARTALREGETEKQAWVGGLLAPLCPSRGSIYLQYYVLRGPLPLDAAETL